MNGPREVWWRSWRSWGWTIWLHHPTQRHSVSATNRWKPVATTFLDKRKEIRRKRKPQQTSTFTSIRLRFLKYALFAPLGCAKGPRYSLWRRWSHGSSLSTPFCTLDQRMSEWTQWVEWVKWIQVCCVQFFWVFCLLGCSFLRTQCGLGVLYVCNWTLKTPWFCPSQDGYSNGSWIFGLERLVLVRIDFYQFAECGSRTSVHDDGLSAILLRTPGTAPLETLHSSCHFVTVEGCQCTSCERWEIGLLIRGQNRERKIVRKQGNLSHVFLYRQTQRHTKTRQREEWTEMCFAQKTVKCKNWKKKSEQRLLSTKRGALTRLAGLLESVRSVLACLCTDRCRQGGADSDTVQIGRLRVKGHELQILSSTTAAIGSHRAPLFLARDSNKHVAK